MAGKHGVFVTVQGGEMHSSPVEKSLLHPFIGAHRANSRSPHR